jgi:hypothetical protein
MGEIRSIISGDLPSLKRAVELAPQNLGADKA